MIDMSCENAVSFIGAGMRRIMERGTNDVEGRYQLLVGTWMGGTVYGIEELGFLLTYRIM